MEHTFTFNSVDEMNLVNDILMFFSENDTRYLRPLDGMVNFNTYPHKENYPVNIESITDRLSGAIVSALEEEKPVYEHRYAVFSCNDTDNPLAEFDDLHEAWREYVKRYEDKYADDYSVEDGDFVLWDNKADDAVTSSVPNMDVEFEWDASIDVRYNGRTVYDYETPRWVMDDISDSISSYGDTSGTASDTIGDIEWGDISNWETEHDDKPEETPTGIKEEAEETSSASESDNTWHFY